MSAKNKIGLEIQKEIKNLIAKRDGLTAGIDAEIEELSAALKALKINGKAGTFFLDDMSKKLHHFVMENPVKATLAAAMHNGGAPKGRKQAKIEGGSTKEMMAKRRSIAIDLLEKKKEVRPLDLAAAASMRNEYASNYLTRLVKEKIAKKIGRGVYAIKA